MTKRRSSSSQSRSGVSKTRAPDIILDPKDFKDGVTEEQAQDIADGMNEHRRKERKKLGLPTED